MSRSLKVRSECIERVKLSVQRNGFPNQRSLSEEIGIALATVSKFLTGKSVDYGIFVEICHKLGLEWREISDIGQEIPPLPEPSKPQPTAIAHNHQDWGEAIDLSVFCGRTGELEMLQQWIVEERCRLVVLLGMGGIGKTTLAVKLAEQIQNEFEYLIWRSLRNSPPIQELLADLIRFLSNQQETDLPDTIDGKISRLLERLRTSRCLLILDNAESILSSEGRVGTYREGYERYEQLFKSIGETRHQSCLVLTTREKPKGLSYQEGENLPIHSLRLSGLAQENFEEIFKEKGFTVSANEGKALVEQYAGNPLALKMVATTIQELFNGDVEQFLEQGTVVFGDISNLLDQQFERLSALEKQTMFWLAINREWVTLTELRDDIIPAVPVKSLIEALESLQLRSLIEKATPTQLVSFTQQPVIMEYVTEKLIENLSQEISTVGEIVFFDRYPLIKAQAKDYLRNAQIRLILKPIIERLMALCGNKNKIKNCLNLILSKLHSSGSTSAQQPGYSTGNILNLLGQLQIDASGYDFSGLTVWQAYLQGMNLHRVNFANSDLTKSVFTQTLGGIVSAAFNSEGKLFATGIDNEIWLWQVADSRQLLSYKGHTSWVHSVAFSPNGKTLASGSNDQTVRLWDVNTGQCLKTFRGHTGCVQAIAFSPDGQILASGSNDQTVRLWDIKTGQCLQVLTGHTNHLLSVIFSPDGETLISSGEDQTVRLWRIKTGECLRIIETHINWVLSVSLSPDGRTLATGSDGKTVKFWDINTGKCLRKLQNYSSYVWAIAYAPWVGDINHPHRQVLATGSEDKTIKIWDSLTGECIQTLQGHSERVWLVLFCHDGRTLMSASENQTVKLWDIYTGNCLRTIEGYSNSVLSVALSSDEQILASSGRDQQVRLWDVVTGECLKILQGHSNIVSAVTFAAKHNESQILASGSDDHTIKIWDGHTGECLRTIWGHSSWVQSLSFSPDRQTLASASRDGTVKLWDWQTGECLQTLEGHIHRVKSVAFSPLPPTPLNKGGEGGILVSGSDDQTVKLWEVQTGICIQTFQGHQDWVLSVAFSPCGSRIVSAGGEIIKLWDVYTGECLQTFFGHTHRVRSVVLSPDGQTLASASDDETVKLWDVSTGKNFRTLQGHLKGVWSVVFSSNGETLVSGSGDETIKFWSVETGECWKTLLAERPYEGMNIRGAIGLSVAQKATLKALGAVEID